ncbi:hypothetical protein KOR34_33760 [Posidoniimonas corsicana]|uniref:Uncharacterized protein n=1 Tax=Posidoniimonas corsicana TaxID=1938618 RepID=A0A5C5V4S6_9BACT|nr:hypothetical protein [Posidoniimonas corsicana]TWT33544.1 hypothetical protein KOR34_33760 [Posidoniimonas corsicana]
MRPPRFSLETLLAVMGGAAMVLAAVRASEDAIFFALIRNFAICVAAYAAVYLTASGWFLRGLRRAGGLTLLLLATLVGGTAWLLLLAVHRLASRGLISWPPLSLDLLLSWRALWIGLLPALLGAVHGWRSRRSRGVSLRED